MGWTHSSSAYRKQPCLRDGVNLAREPLAASLAMDRVLGSSHRVLSLPDLTRAGTPWGHNGTKKGENDGNPGRAKSQVNPGFYSNSLFAKPQQAALTRQLWFESVNAHQGITPGHDEIVNDQGAFFVLGVAPVVRRW